MAAADCNYNEVVALVLWIPMTVGCRGQHASVLAVKCNNNQTCTENDKLYEIYHVTLISWVHIVGSLQKGSIFNFGLFRPQKDGGIFCK